MIDGEKLNSVFELLCNSDGQPHQWVGNRSGLERIIWKELGCPRCAEWMIHDDDPYAFTYSCTKHLSVMVSDSTVRIVPFEGELENKPQECCCVAVAGNV